MLELQSPKQIMKRARANKGLINTRSHVQKKYFSLMLVPSYSSGKTRSVRIPHTVFYFLFFTMLAIGAVVLFMYLRADFHMQRAQYTADSLEQMQEAYVSLQETTEEELRRLTENSVHLHSELIQERIRGQEEQYQQRLTYLETLEAIQNYIEGLEDQLQQFEDYRQDILDQLSASAHIPPVRNMLNEMYQSQMHLLATLEDLNAYNIVRREQAAQNSIGLMAASPTVVSSHNVADDLINHIAMLELSIEIKAELFSLLEEEVRRMMPYIRNYPTLRPVNGSISSGFGWRRNPFGGRGSEMHRGIDISAPRGTTIRATGGGTVIFSDWSGAYGNKVIICHGLGLRTLYAHNSENLVNVGQTVARGETIARVGSTGRSTGPHVHYEVLVNGSAVNPAGFFLE